MPNATEPKQAGSLSTEDPVNLNTEEDEEDAIDDKVRQLRKSDFMKRGAEAPEAAIA